MAPRLRHINTTRLASGAELLSYCDPHDLIAIVTTDSKVLVYRINGQLAFSIPNSSIDPLAISWKQDGSRLALGHLDGTYEVYSGEDGKLLYTDTIRGPDDPEEDAPPAEEGYDDHIIAVSGFGWMKHTIHNPTHHDPQPGHQTAAQMHYRDDLSDDGEASEGHVAHSGTHSTARLARSIVSLDVTDVLPKLSSIPSHGLHFGLEGSKFSNQQSTDAVLDPQKQSSPDKVDILVALGTNSTATVVLDDAVKIGRCQVGWRPMHHASSPKSGVHAIIAHDNFEQHYELSFIKLPLEALGGSLLSVIATNTKRMKSLLAYISHTLRCIAHDFKTGIQTQDRFVANGNATLAEDERSRGNLQVNLTELALTGNFSPPMLEWLTEILREANHKRWDQAISTMYANIQNHIFINLLPALERLSIAATTLRGHARVAENSAMFNVDPNHFTNIVGAVDHIRVVAESVQSLVINKRQQFAAFSKWLRVMIEIGVAVPGSKSALETEEREVPNLDYELVLSYINSIDPALQSDHAANFATEVPLFVQSIEMAVNAALKATTEWQSTMLTSPTTHDIQTPPRTFISDVTMHSTGAVAAVARCTTPGQEHKLHFVAVADPPDYPAAFREVLLGIAGEVTIHDAKFSKDGQEIFILVSPSDDSTFEVRRARVGALLESSMRRTLLATEILHVSSEGDEGFSPHKLYVGGRLGKDVLVLVADRMWKILDLHHAEDEEMGDAMGL